MKTQDTYSVESIGDGRETLWGRNTQLGQSFHSLQQNSQGQQKPTRGGNFDRWNISNSPFEKYKRAQQETLNRAAQCIKNQLYGGKVLKRPGSGFTLDAETTSLGSSSVGRHIHMSQKNKKTLEKVLSKSSHQHVRTRNLKSQTNQPLKRATGPIGCLQNSKSFIQQVRDLQATAQGSLPPHDTQQD